jgi:hypothetical protein
MIPDRKGIPGSVRKANSTHCIRLGYAIFRRTQAYAQ